MKIKGDGLNKRTFVLLSIGLALISGCAAKFTIIDRSDGQIYMGTTDGATMGGSGYASLVIEGETYSGPWIYQSSGGSFGFGSFSSTAVASGSATTIGARGGVGTTTLGGVGTASGTSSSYGVSAVGNGMINARSSSGKFVRCVFSFNTMNNTGIGECLRNDGRTYDLNVKR